jgi:hypothetical protein
VIVLIVILLIGAGAFLYTAAPTKHTTTTSTTSITGSTQTGNSTLATNSQTTNSTQGPFKVIYVSLNVGYDSGLWQLSIQDVSGKPVKLLTAVLNTPTQSKMCTGEFGGFGFSNCPTTPPSSGVFATNATFTGFATGQGAGSATPGTTYSITLDVVWGDGTTVNATIPVTAETT